MNFRTIIEKQSYKNLINYKDSSLFIGSCFTENIGKRLLETKFKIDINPFGVVYNAASVCKIIEIVAKNQPANGDMFCNIDQQYYSFLHTTKVYADSSQQLTEKLDNITNRANKHLKDSKNIFITLGTSWIYRLSRNGEVVNNCLKVSDREFTRELLSVEQTVELFDNLFRECPELIDKNIYFTVSPIRHTRDGFVQNSLSKSNIISAIHILIEKYSNISYFPAYEIMNDELRDYRFYEEDMIHPSKIAIEYIFEKFYEWVLDSESRNFYDQNKKLNISIQHRPLNTKNIKFAQFCNSCLNNIEKLKKKYPEVDYSKEELHFTNINIEKNEK